MTELLEFAVASAMRLSAERQDDLAREILRFLEKDKAVETADPAHVAAIRSGLAQIRRGEFASDEEVEAVYRSFDQ